MTDKASTTTLTRFQLRDLDPTSAQQLSTLQKDFPGHTARACAAG
jgi:hypothetical protein